MKRLFLASLFSLTGWTSCVLAQGSLGTPVANLPPGEPINGMPVPSTPHLDYKTQFCQSGFGQLAKSLLVPVRMATGNLLPPAYVETVSKEDIARMAIDGGYSTAEMAAARIKLDESQAKLRRSAVRYLASVNCHYYPEAEAGLIAALRADRNECVRLEAALALGSGQCCSPRIVDALSITAMGCELDGNPAEISPRVRAAAQAALNRWLTPGCCQPTGMPQMLPSPDCSGPQTLPPPSPFTVTPSSYMAQPTDYFVPMLPDPMMPAPMMAVPMMQEPISPALMYERSRAENVSAGPKNATLSTGQRSLYHLIVNATYREPTANPTAAPFVPPTPRRPPAHPLGLSPLGTDAQLAIPSTPAYVRSGAYNE